eukprot:CCRYP_007640-RC/>CCRYP_007640-RC protein AED:0.59 eAED:0.66 QI:0/-1/0/1/-1/0/1/0/176
MSSATEAELAALYIVAHKAVDIQIILEETGHKQPRTPIQTDNSMADVVINEKIQPKRKKLWTCIFIGYRTRNANTSSISTGVQVKLIMQTTGQNTTLPHIMSTSQQSSSPLTLCSNCCSNNSSPHNLLLLLQHKHYMHLRGCDDTTISTMYICSIYFELCSHSTASGPSPHISSLP